MGNPYSQIKDDKTKTKRPEYFMWLNKNFQSDGCLYQFNIGKHLFYNYNSTFKYYDLNNICYAYNNHHEYLAKVVFLDAYLNGCVKIQITTILPLKKAFELVYPDRVWSFIIDNDLKSFKTYFRKLDLFITTMLIQYNRKEMCLHVIDSEKKRF